MHDLLVNCFLFVCFQISADVSVLHPWQVVYPSHDPKIRKYHDTKYRIFRDLYEQQLTQRAMLKEALSDVALSEDQTFKWQTPLCVNSSKLIWMDKNKFRMLCIEGVYTNYMRRLLCFFMLNLYMVTHCLWNRTGIFQYQTQ